MRAHIEAGNVMGLYTVILEDGRVFHDRDAFQVQDLIKKFGLVEVSNRTQRAEAMMAIVRAELGEGVPVEWTAFNDHIVLTCVYGGRDHRVSIAPLADDEAETRAWCRRVLDEA